MLEGNYFFVTCLFALSLAGLFFLSGKNLRPKIIIDPYFFLYLTLASMFCLHAWIFLFYEIDLIFVITYTLAYCFFILGFGFASRKYSNKLELIYSTSFYKRNYYDVNYLFRFRPFLIALFFGGILLYINIQEGLFRLENLTSLYGGNSAYLQENNSARYFNYLKGVVNIVSIYLIIYIIYCDNKSFLKNVLVFLFFSGYIFSLLLAGSRSGLVTAFLVIGIITIADIYNKKLHRRLFKIQILIVLFAVILAIYITADALVSDYYTAALSFIERLLLNSDVGFRYHLAKYPISISQFENYSFSYYFKPYLTALGIMERSNGIGPQILVLSYIDAPGKGPIPTFIYESYIISKSPTYTILYSFFLGMIIPAARYFSIIYFRKLIYNSSGIKFLIFIAWFSFGFGPTGDVLNFQISYIINILVTSLLFILMFFRPYYFLKENHE